MGVGGVEGHKEWLEDLKQTADVSTSCWVGTEKLHVLYVVRARTKRCIPQCPNSYSS
jgi:hypothetical protein